MNAARPLSRRHELSPTARLARHASGRHARRPPGFSHAATRMPVVRPDLARSFRVRNGRRHRANPSRHPVATQTSALPAANRCRVRCFLGQPDRGPSMRPLAGDDIAPDRFSGDHGARPLAGRDVRGCCPTWGCDVDPPARGRAALARVARVCLRRADSLADGPGTWVVRPWCAISHCNRPCSRGNTLPPALCWCIATLPIHLYAKSSSRPTPWRQPL